MAEAEKSSFVGSVEHFPSPNENITGEDNAITDEAEATHGVDKNEVKIKSERLKKRTDSVKILIIGLMGVGKSSLVNAMMGDIVAISKAGARACQTQVVCHEGEREGIRIKIYDTAGFGEAGISEKKILKNIAENTPRRGYDLILIAIKMDNRLDADNAKKMLSFLGRLMEPEMWKRTIVVLTFANFFVLQLNHEYQDSVNKEGIKFEVERKMQEFKKVFQEHTGKDWGLVSEIPFVLAGTMKQRQLPTVDDWLVTLWDQSILRCRTEAKPFLKCIRFQRLFVDLHLLIRNIFPITSDSEKDSSNAENVPGQEGQAPFTTSTMRQEMPVKDDFNWQQNGQSGLREEPRDGDFDLQKDGLEHMGWDLLSEIDFNHFS
uniref:AIG1-type G domain-containing protein n=1 Tax=Amphimedon queenslandica TaxID=400682 RepID=A0A1X7VMP1_AMPQE